MLIPKVQSFAQKGPCMKKDPYIKNKESGENPSCYGLIDSTDPWNGWRMKIQTGQNLSIMIDLMKQGYISSRLRTAHVRGRYGGRGCRCPHMGE